MNLKEGIIVAIIFIALLVLSGYSIWYMVDSGTDIIEVDNVKFNIPQGFKEIENSNTTNIRDDFKEFNISYTNGTESFSITVLESKNQINDDFEILPHEKRNYNGIDGYLVYSDGYRFDFLKDNNYKVGSVKVENEELLNYIITSWW